MYRSEWSLNTIVVNRFIKPVACDNSQQCSWRILHIYSWDCQEEEIRNATFVPKIEVWSTIMFVLVYCECDVWFNA